MYQRDVALIKDYAMESPYNLHDVVTFTLCTIQAGLSTCQLQISDICVNGAVSKYLWGAKASGYVYARDNAVYLWERVALIAEQGMDDPANVAEAVLLFMQVPGLGMVKASFVCQMLGFNVACLDSHNLQRLGLSVSAVKVDAKAKVAAKRIKVIEYVKLCQQQGSEYWWDSWCDYVAGNKANRRLDTGDAVSAYHVDCVMFRQQYNNINFSLDAI